MASEWPDDPMMDQARRLAALRKALEARLARLPPEEAGDGLTRDGALAPDPARCPSPPCRRAGKCRRPTAGACLDDPVERMRRAIYAKLMAAKRASRTG